MNINNMVINRNDNNEWVSDMTVKLLPENNKRLVCDFQS